MEQPKAGKRDTVLTQEEYDRLLPLVPCRELRELIEATWETGCRPQESLQVEARHVELHRNRWVFPEQEGKGEIGRVVYLTENAAAITRRLMARHPSGKLFRNSNGKLWTTAAVTVHRVSAAGMIDDPLLTFTERLRTGDCSAFSETVNLSPLFTCHGALLEAETEQRGNWAVRRHNARILQGATDGTPWQMVPTDKSLRSQIVMLNRSRATPSHPDQVRTRFHEIQVALTAYSNGSIRLSLPFSRLESHERELLMAAFRRA